MKCPLPIFYRSSPSGLAESELRDCIKEECAWWVETQDRCAIKDIALSLGYVAMDMTQILEKLPPAKK